MDLCFTFALPFELTALKRSTICLSPPHCRPRRLSSPQWASSSRARLAGCPSHFPPQTQTSLSHTQLFQGCYSLGLQLTKITRCLLTSSHFMAKACVTSLSITGFLPLRPQSPFLCVFSFSPPSYPISHAEPKSCMTCPFASPLFSLRC